MDSFCPASGDVVTCHARAILSIFLLELQSNNYCGASMDTLPPLKEYTADALQDLRRVPRPSRLPSDQSTMLVYTCKISTTPHTYRTKCQLVICPIIEPPHTYFRCKDLTLSVCCQPSKRAAVYLENQTRRQVGRLLRLKCPQVTCNLDSIPW